MRTKVLWKQRFLLVLSVLMLFSTAFTTLPKTRPGLDTCTNPTPAGTCPPG